MTHGESVKYSLQRHCYVRDRKSARVGLWRPSIESAAHQPQSESALRPNTTLRVMAHEIAPWLRGLEEPWELPKGAPTASRNISSASHDADAIKNTQRRGSRIPRRSPNGPRQGSRASTQSKRSPLAPLSRSNTNTIHWRADSTSRVMSPTESQTCAGEAVLCGTVQIQPRAKSESPGKKQETLEWKKRLVQGRVGYGDQTDLFGPSGLENIFAPSSAPEKDVPRTRIRTGRPSTSSVDIPSSPPVFRSSLPSNPSHEQQAGSSQGTQLRMVGAEVLDHDLEVGSSDNSHHSSDGLGHPPPKCESSSSRRIATMLARHNSEDSVMCVQEEVEKERNDGSELIPQSHQISGPTELEQEDVDFSPVFISKHMTMTGQVNYAALDSRTIRNSQGTEKDLGQTNIQKSSEGKATSQEQNQAKSDQSIFTDDPQSDVLLANPDLSLSENLPTGTPPVLNLGHYVEVKRGGYSAYSSFKERPLSSSPSKEEDSTDRLASAWVSTTIPEMEQSPTMQPHHAGPTTPLRPCTPDPPKTRSSGSPLKLFGAHDTFTNKRLLRRLSEFNPAENALAQQNRAISSESKVLARAVTSTWNTKDNSFGSGDLDDHSFRAEITITSASDSDNENSTGSPSADIPVPGAKISSAFRFASESIAGRVVKPQKKAASKHGLGVQHQPGLDDVESAAEDVQYREYGKRPPTSPCKHPTPKRRRTLHASELELSTVQIEFPSQQSITSAESRTSSRKRKDAKQGEQHNLADPAILATRRMLRPRNPTPSQDRRQELEAEVREAAEEYAAAHDRSKLEAVIEQVDSSCLPDGQPTLQEQAEAVATEVAAFTLRVSSPAVDPADDGVRKRSVTTQDFLNEAMMVMNLIRAKARRPQSGLGSVEESDAEGFNNSSPPDESVESLRVSRPPSRDGAPSGWRTNVRPQTDARVVSHLRKFQERDDTEFIAESLVSLDIDEDSVNDNVVALDTDANIRIIGPPSSSRGQSDAIELRPNSQRSSGSILHTETVSTGHTVGTSSTKHSENIGTLAPDAVTHLIGEQVGTMTFDKVKKCWVRVRSSENKQSKAGFLDLPSHVSSEDDPFREISDLPVDEQLESRRSSGNTTSAQREKSGPRFISVHDQQPVQSITPPVTSATRITLQESAVSRPVTRDNNTILHYQSSSVPSRYTVLASSQTGKAETRATSWSDEDLLKLATMSRMHERPLEVAAAQATLALREEPDTAVKGIAAEAIRGPQLDEATSGENGLVDVLDPDDRSDTNVTVEELESRGQQYPSSMPHHSSSHRAVAWPTSSRKQALTRRFASDTKEESEMTMTTALPGQRVLSLSLSVSRPIATRYLKYPPYNVQSSPCRVDSTFMLSDLPEFTIHEEDVQRPSEQILARRLVKHAARDSNDRFTLASKELVKVLTDVQEHELYWEDVKKLDLKGRSLISLHGLEQFCERLQDIDVSSNVLLHLDGIPSTVRSLSAAKNQLSSLTGWGHIHNLQYLNISGNALDNVMGLGQLVHLRELHADDNQITSLEGISDLDGLLKLRLRRNRLDQVDFANTQLHRLTDLDLSDNQIIAATNLGALSSLKILKLDANSLEGSFHRQTSLPHLEVLSLRTCGLYSLSVSLMPRLRTLIIDDNHLRDVEGVSSLKHLESLSMCRQKLPEGSFVTILEQHSEARILKLNGNILPTLRLTRTFLNLRHLEIASVGLCEVSDDLGLKLPNLGTLNLNFNALRDIRPLLNIQKLQHLSICGNRLHRLRTTVATLAKLTTLESLDLRDNPVVQGLYAPPLTIPTSMIQISNPIEEPEEDERSVLMEIARYTLSCGTIEQDMNHRERMDEATKLRRRVYELMLAKSCPRLLVVDGLSFDKTSAAVKDEIFDRLVELKVMRRSNKERNGHTELMDNDDG
nr:septation initiation network scaffold protein cdc11 [Quercus suber]